MLGSLTIRLAVSECLIFRVSRVSESDNQTELCGSL